MKVPSKSTIVDHLIMVFIFGLFVGLFHSQAALDLNGLMLGNSPDAVKNYYTPAYHIANDAGFSRFEGMHYPYGEQVVFTDNQPSLSNALKLLHHVGLFNPEYTVGFLNAFMLISILICSFFVYRICNHYLPQHARWNAVFAISLALLNPQLHRMGGHYALAYAFVIPMAWWLYIKYQKHYSWAVSFIMAAYLLFVAGIHMYYLALIAGFWLALFAFTHLLSRFKSIKLSSVLQLLLQVGLPVLILMVWISATGSESNRPSDPYGFLVYKAHLEGIFLPLKAGFIDFSEWFPPSDVRWEGIAYIGVFGAIMVTVVLFWLLKSLIRRNTIFQAQKLQAFGWAGLVFLCFSLGIPFIFGLEHWVDYLGPIKQFRGIGRFAWVFFYVVNIVGWILFLSYVKQRLIIALALGLVMINAINHQFKVYALTPNALSTAPAKVEFTDFQAIFPIPYFHTGSENFDLPHRSEAVFQYSLATSYQTGLPICAAQLSRTDFLKSISNIKMAYTLSEVPEAIIDMNDQRPFLLMTDTATPLNAAEISMISFARYIGTWQGIKHYTLPFDYFQKNLIAARINAWNDFEMLAIDSLPRPLLYKDFGLDTAKGFLSVGAFMQPLIGNALFLDTMVTFSNTDTLALSFWTPIKQDGLPLIDLIVHFEAQDELGIDYWSMGKIRDHIVTISKGWALIEKTISITPGKYHLKATLDQQRLKSHTKIDHLLLRKSSEVFAYQTGDLLWLNNRVFPKNVE